MYVFKRPGVLIVATIIVNSYNFNIFSYMALSAFIILEQVHYLVFVMTLFNSEK